MIDTTAETGFMKACALLLLGNLLDGVFTFAYLQCGVACEANPVMRWFYAASPLAFMLFKLSCVQLGLLVLWMHRSRATAAIGVRVTAGLYTAIVAYHFAIMVGLRA